MWHNILTKEEPSKGTDRTETNLRPDPSPEENWHVSTVENLDTSRRTVDTLQDKCASNDVEPKKISQEKGTSPVATSEEELLFICEQASVNLANEECTWVIDSGASFHITPLCFST